MEEGSKLFLAFCGAHSYLSSIIILIVSLKCCEITGKLQHLLGRCLQVNHIVAVYVHDIKLGLCKNRSFIPLVLAKTLESV